MAQIAGRMERRFLVPVIYGSVRTARQGIKAARFVQHELVRRGIEAVLIDPLERPLPLLDRMYKEFPKGTAPAVLEELADALPRKADGFAIVSGEYNNDASRPRSRTCSTIFSKSIFGDRQQLHVTPAAVGEAMRAAMQLRMSVGGNGHGNASVDPADGFYVGKKPSAMPATPTDPKTTQYSAQFFDEFVWYMEALRARRQAGVPY